MGASAIMVLSPSGSYSIAQAFFLCCPMHPVETELPFFTSSKLGEDIFVFFSATLGNYGFPFGWNKSNCNYTQNALLLRITKYKKAEKIKRKETWLINSHKINHILTQLISGQGKTFL